MDFVPWSLEWSQVIGIKSDKGVQLVVHWEGSELATGRKDQLVAEG